MRRLVASQAKKVLSNTNSATARGPKLPLILTLSACPATLQRLALRTLAGLGLQRYLQIRPGAAGFSSPFHSLTLAIPIPGNAGTTSGD